MALGTSYAPAEIPGSTYRTMQARAHEVLDIVVQAVTTSSTTRPYQGMGKGGSEKTTNLTMVAKIDHVVRTANKIIPGSVITIRYVVKEYEPIAPPRGHSPAILSIGDKARVYLRHVDAGTYDLAAEGESILKR